MFSFYISFIVRYVNITSKKNTSFIFMHEEFLKIALKQYQSMIGGKSKLEVK